MCNGKSNATLVSRVNIQAASMPSAPLGEINARVQVFSNEAKVTSGQTESGNIARARAHPVSSPTAMLLECTSSRLQETANSECALLYFADMFVILLIWLTVM